MYAGRTKWKVAELEVAENVVAESVAVVEEAQVSKPGVKMASMETVVKGKKKRRVGELTRDHKGAREVREEFIALSGPGAIREGFTRRVAQEAVFAGADPRLVAGGDPTGTTVGISRGTDAWHQSPEARAGYLLRPRVGYWGGRGYRRRGRGRGVSNIVCFHAVFRDLTYCKLFS